MTTYRLIRSKISDQGQRGSTLLTAMVVIAVLFLILSAMMGLMMTSQRSSEAYADQRVDRYSGDAAVNGAVNWVAAKSNVGRDPEYFTSDDPCRYVAPASGTEPATVVTCAAEPGSGSGVPADTGKVPDQALLLLGQRYGESAYQSPCTSNSRTSRTSGEVGLRLNSGRLRNSGGTIKCDYPGAGMFDPAKPFQIQGGIKSNSPVVADQGKLVVLNPDRVTAGSSPLFDNAACSGTVQVQAAASCDLVSTTRSRTDSTIGPDPMDPWDPGESLFDDPAVTGSKTADWRQGKINWRAPQVSINGNAPIGLTTLTSLAQCTGTSSDLVRFYPAWYSSAAALNRIFNDTESGKTCKNGVFWFAPAADDTDSISSAVPDVADAEQGVYLFDFRDSGTGTDETGKACQYFSNTNYPHRWCIDADTADGGPMVVAGWPANWDPQTHIGSSGASSTTVSLGSAQTDTDRSLTWYTNGVSDNASGASQLNDGKWAKYDPFFTSYNRSVILKNFTRKLTAVDPAGHVSITVVHREHRSTNLEWPVVTVSTSDRGQAISCGQYSVPKSYDSSPSTGGNGVDSPRTDVISTDPSVSTISLSADQRNVLKNCFSSAERVNHVQLRWSVSGSYLNINWSHPFGGPPNLFLDGMDVSVQVPSGGWFPDGGTKKTVYCDPLAEPGVQFIFGGDSTVHVGQSGFQICAGHAPSNPSAYQQIAIWGQPLNFLTKESGTSQTETRVGAGKVQRSTLVPTTVNEVSHDCSACLSTPDISNEARSAGGATPYTQNSDKNSYVSTMYDMGNTFFGETSLTGRYSGFGGVKSYSTCNASTDVCIDTDTQKVSRVELKVAYNTDCGTALSSEEDPWCPGAGDVSFKFRKASDGSLLSCGPSGYGDHYLPANKTMMWYSLDVSSCFDLGSGDSTSRLNDVSVDLTFECKVCISHKEKLVSSVELEPVLGPKTAATRVVMPADGCRTSPSGYGAGVGDAAAPTKIDSAAWYQRTTSEQLSRDCALISGGRVSVHGTIYAPSDALEIADSDSRYPFASRGVVARHLRIRAYSTPLSPQEPSISNKIDGTPAPREAVFVACTRSNLTANDQCGTLPGDRVLTRARVRFEVDTTKQAKVPNVVWWSTDR